MKNNDTENGILRLTDEKLYDVMLRKKQLMEEFLTSIKEVSIDCMVNYEHKDKCLSFPLRAINQLKN